MKTPRTLTRVRRSRITAGLALGAAAALALVGCSSNATPTEPTAAPEESAPAENGQFDQALHDLLPDSVKSSGVLSFGGLWETPPTLYLDEKDPTTPVGLAPEMAALFGEILGVDVEWQNLAWPAQLPGLQAGSVDALFGQVSINEERELSIVDLIPFQKRGHGLLVAAGNPEKIDSIASLCGLTIGVPIGSNQSATVQRISDADCVGQGKPAIEMAEYQGAAAAVQALRGGTVDAWLDVELNVAATVAADPDVFAAVDVPQNEMPTEFSGIAVSKENVGVSEALLGAMKTILENGEYENIYGSRDLDLSMITVADLKINPITGTPAGEMAE